MQILQGPFQEFENIIWFLLRLAVTYNLKECISNTNYYNYARMHLLCYLFIQIKIYGLTYLANKPKIVTNQQHSTVKAIYCISKCIDRFHIKMVCWFIQKKKMWSSECQPCKNYSAPLPVRKIAHSTSLKQTYNVLMSLIHRYIFLILIHRAEYSEYG